MDYNFVTPFVGVWIETCGMTLYKLKALSHPSWVCGLKLASSLSIATRACHTLRGCVD